MTRDRQREPDAVAVAQLGRYSLLTELATSDITTVHLARHRSDAGFSRLVALKRLRPPLVRQPEYVALLQDEARLGAGLNHANLVAAVDAGFDDTEAYLVMDYVEGDSLAGLLRRAGHERHPRFIAPLLVDVLSGLHAAHTALGPEGTPMALVHQAPRAEHILVGIDGMARLCDFGQARSPALHPSRLRTDRLRIAHMAPEQVLKPDVVDRRADLFILGVVMWEALTGRRLFEATTEEQTFQNLLHRRVMPPSEVNPESPPCLDGVCLTALEREPAHRYESAAEMARDLRDTAINHALLATAQEVGQWVKALCGSDLITRRRLAGGDTPSQQISIDDGSGSGLFESPRSTSAFTTAFAADDAPTRLHPSVAPAKDAGQDAHEVPVFTDERTNRYTAEDTAPIRTESVAPSAFVAAGPGRADAHDSDESSLPALYDATDPEAPTRVMPSLSEQQADPYAEHARPTRKVDSLAELSDREARRDPTERHQTHGVEVSVGEPEVSPSPLPERDPTPTDLRRREVREENRLEQAARSDSQPRRMPMSSGPVGDVFAPSEHKTQPSPAPASPAAHPPLAAHPDSLAPPSQAHTLPPEEELDDSLFLRPGRGRAMWVVTAIAATALLGWVWISAGSEPAQPAAVTSPTRVEDDSGDLPAEGASKPALNSSQSASLQAEESAKPTSAPGTGEREEGQQGEKKTAAQSEGKAAAAALDDEHEKRAGRKRATPSSKRDSAKAKRGAKTANTPSRPVKKRKAAIDWRDRGQAIPDNPF